VPPLRTRVRGITGVLPALAAFILGVVLAGWWMTMREETADSAIRLILNVPSTDQVVPGAVGLSPDGKRVVYVARRAGQTQLFIRDLDKTQPTPLNGTEEATDPMFSHNGESIIFLQQQKPKKLSVAGGTVTEIANSPVGRGFAVLRDGSVGVSDAGVKAYNTETRAERIVVFGESIVAAPLRATRRRCHPVRQGAKRQC
jgi:hypothetical protein